MPTDSTTAAWGAAAEVAGTAVNAASYANANKKQRQFSREMYDLQRTHALADRAFQNEYNSPAAQMARLKEGGLNPNLVYGNGAATQEAAQTRGADVKGYDHKTPQLDMGHMLNAFMALKTELPKQEAETDRIKAITDLIKEQNVAQAIGNKSSEIDYGVKKLMSDTGVLVKNERNKSDQLAANVNYTINNDERQKLLSAQTIKESIERAAKARAERLHLLPVQVAKIMQDIRVGAVHEKILRADAALKKDNLSFHDPAYLRLASKILNELFEPDSKND